MIEFLDNAPESFRAVSNEKMAWGRCVLDDGTEYAHVGAIINKEKSELVIQFNDLGVVDKLNVRVKTLLKDLLWVNEYAKSIGVHTVSFVRNAPCKKWDKILQLMQEPPSVTLYVSKVRVR